MRYLLDTNICVHILQGKNGIAEKISQAGEENCFISEITKVELLVGAEVSEANGYVNNAQIVRAFLGTVQTVPISDAIELFASEKVRLRLSGYPIEDFDLLIGCTAVSHGMIMVSENESHLARISGIRIANWTKRLNV